MKRMKSPELVSYRHECFSTCSSFLNTASLLFFFFFFRTAAARNWKKTPTRRLVKSPLRGRFLTNSFAKTTQEEPIQELLTLQTWTAAVIRGCRQVCHTTSSIFRKMRFIFHEATQEVTPL